MLLREAELARKVAPDGVPVEQLHEQTARLELGDDEPRERRLPGPREAGEPDDEGCGVGGHAASLYQKTPL